MGTLKRIGAALLLLPAALWADEVHLENGGVVSGVIVERTAQAIVLETGPGRVTLPLSRVARVVESRSSLATFQERAAATPPADVEGLARLARWADDHDLATQARETWLRVLALDPGHPEANGALGRTYLDGAWMNESDAYRAQGYVRYRDRWVTPAEHDALVRERASREQAASDRMETEMRLREAEARAREAEARAREAEILADQAEGSANGIPYWWVLAGGGGPIWPPGGHHPGPPLLLPEHPIARPPARPPYGMIQGERPAPRPGGGLSPSSPGSRAPTGTISSGNPGGSGIRN